MQAYCSKSKGKKVLKAYNLSLSRSVDRAVYLELESNFITTTEFIKSFKKFISRRGKPNIYSNSAKTFRAGGKWLNIINRDEKFHDFFNKERLIWKFSLSRAPWWGGQYERS